MKNTSLFIALAISAAGFSSQAQTTAAEVFETPAKAGGVYYAYPIESSLNTPAPKGFSPFYITHYGRHGSRYLTSDKDYTDPLGKLRIADERNALTPYGKEILGHLESVWSMAEGRIGELTELGAAQHRGIAKRMYNSFPEVFSGNPEITAASTVIMRCAHSMFAFVEGLKEINPSLRIPRESSQRNMDYLNYHDVKSDKCTSRDAEWYQSYRTFRREMLKPERLLDTLFCDSIFIRNFIDPEEFMADMYYVAVGQQNLDSDISFDGLFTPHELFDLWQVANYRFYSRNSSYPPAGGLMVDNAKNLASNILEGAEKYIAENKNGATLRFGHDGNIIPFIALMRLGGKAAYCTNPYDLYKEYSDFNICPMGSNFQMVLFKNKKGDIIAKFMLNEREVPIAIDSDIYPFYRWDDVRKYFEEAIEVPSVEIMNRSLETSAGR